MRGRKGEAAVAAENESGKGILKLARRVAAETGESLTEAIIHSLEERLERIEARRSAPDLAETLIAIGRRCSFLPDLDTREADEILGYDETGDRNAGAPPLLEASGCGEEKGTRLPSGQEIESEAAAERTRAGKAPLGPAAVLAQHPHDHPECPKRSPAPLVHAASKLFVASSGGSTPHS